MNNVQVIRRCFMKYTMLIIFILSMHIYAQETNSIKLKMDTYETNTKLKWNYNPFKNYDTDRYFSSWADPNAYNSSFLLGKIFNIKEMYKNPNFKFDNIDFFLSAYSCNRSNTYII